MKFSKLFKKAAALCMAAVTALSVIPATTAFAAGDIGTISFSHTYDSGGNAMRYDNQDLEHLSMIMTLHDMGFTSLEVETYMKLLLAGDSTKWERMKMLNEKRSQALDEIHLKERQLERMDYLRNEIRNNK